MSWYIHPGGTIRKRYTNLPKGNNIESLLLVGGRNRSVSSKGVELRVYYFFHGEFVDVDFFALWHYIHVVAEGTEEFLLIIQKRGFAIGISCNRSMSQRHRT